MVFGDKKEIQPSEALELFWLLFDLNVLPMATWSFDGHFITVNQALLDMIGYTKEDFAEKKISWIDLTPSEYHFLDEKCKEELCSQYIATPYEKEYIRKDSSRVKVRLHNATHDLGDAKKCVVMMVPFS